MKLTKLQLQAIARLLEKPEAESIDVTIKGCALPERGALILHIRDHWSTEHHVVDRQGIVSQPGQR
jgi:hypothetical protein